MDPNSSANTSCFLTTHLNLNWTVDFTSKILKGFVELSLKRIDQESKIVILDASHIRVHSVSLGGSELKFESNEKASPFGGSLAIDVSTVDWPVEEVKTVKIGYETTEACSAAQWLTPEQTVGKIHPYLFTQCQAIHARSLLPCQDTPSVKAPYTAQITLPKGLQAVMSANEFSDPIESLFNDPDDSNDFDNPNYSDDPDNSHVWHTFKFTQSTPIPSYLIALGAGNLQSKSIGPRSLVWSEPEVLEAAAWEFAPAESFIQAAEQITGFAYIWGRYDVLLLPPSFPYGGMENPCLTFLTPSLLTGDRSLVDVLAHEIAHSWTGNLVTAANWQHFWLNEGFTMFLERKILARVHASPQTKLDNEPLRQFNAICGLADLKEAIDQFGPQNPATKLIPDLSATDPDDVFSSVPYEKGHTFLAYLEELVGGPAAFNPFLQYYISTFAHKSITSTDFRTAFETFFQGRLQGVIDWEAWLNGTGHPPHIPNYDRSLMIPCEALLQNIEASSSPNDFFALSLDQKVVLLDLLAAQKQTPFKVLARLESDFHLASESNVEICLRWYLLALRANYTDSSVPSAALKFITQHGRMKYNRPIYRELYKLGGEFRQRAIQTFKENSKFYHPIAAAMIEKDLKLK